MTLTVVAPAESDVVPSVLAQARVLTDPAMRSVIDRLHPWLQRMCLYTLGWCAADGSPTQSDGGKAVRPAFAVLSAELVGGDPSRAMPGAVAVELIHTFSLLHDDIMDDDDTRRGRPTVWFEFGTGPAVLAGDALFALAVEVLGDARGQAGSDALWHLAKTLPQLVFGQAQDVTFEQRPWVGPRAVSLNEYRAIVGNKTGALLGCAAAIGAVLSGASGSTANYLSLAGRHFGMAFQAVDDLLGLWGCPATTGKPVLSDLRRAKKTLPVLLALAGESSASKELAKLLEFEPVDGWESDEAELNRALELIEAAGGRHATEQEARRQHELAVRALRRPRLHGPARAELEGLAEFLLDRGR